MSRSDGYVQFTAMTKKVARMGILDSKVAVITGGTSGIGAATAEELVASGARVVIAGRRIEQGRRVAAELGPRASYVPVDVTVETEVESLITQTTEHFGRLDCLINSAGEGGSPEGIATIDLARLQQTLAVHVGGVAATMKFASPFMISQDSGSIINVASVGGQVAGWSSLDYSTAKAAVIHLTRCAAIELAEHGVRVNSLSPGPILTGIFAKGAGIDPAVADRDAMLLEPAFRTRLEMWQPIRRAGLPRDIAAAALWLASDASSFVTGQDLTVDGGITAGRPPAAWTADRATIAKVLVGGGSGL